MDESSMAGDLMIGVKPIAQFLGQPERKVFYWAEMGQLPLFKLGNKWAARKSTIRQHFAALESSRAP